MYRTILQHPHLAAIGWCTPKSLQQIEIDGKIGGGLLVYHKTGCVISPYSAGINLTVSQGVTIGKGKPNDDGIDAPIIGDNVQICTNAVVFGGIEIGDNTIVGAGTVLNKSVPPNCTVVGNPAMIVKRNGIKCLEKL